MNHKKFNLPSREEMIKRLLKVDDNEYLVEHLYPKLLKKAGSKKTAIGVVMMLKIAIYHCPEDTPINIEKVMDKRMSGFIDALCSDEEIAEEAKKFLELLIAIDEAR